MVSETKLIPQETKTTDTTQDAPKLEQTPEQRKNVTELKQQLNKQVKEVYATLQQILDESKNALNDQIARDRAKMVQEQQSLEEEHAKFKKVHQFPANIELDVGGVFYKTSLETLRAIPNSLLGVMFSGEYSLVPDSNGRYFIDRNGKLFRYILDFLRDGMVHLPEDEEKRLRILREGKFYGLQLIPPDDDNDDDEDVDDDVIITDWALDPTCKNPNIALSNNNRTASYVGSSGHASVLGNKGFKTGIHKWSVKIVGPPYWTGVGVIAKSALTSDLSSDYNGWFGCSSSSQLYKVTGPISNWVQGEVIKVTLNCDNGTVNIVGNATNVTATVPKNVELFPIVNLYNSGNILQILDNK